MQSDVVGSVDECNIMVVRQTDLLCALTAPSMIHIPSLSDILLEYFVSNVDCMISLIRERQKDITLIEFQSTRVGVNNLRMGRMTLAHVQKHCHV